MVQFFLLDVTGNVRKDQVEQAVKQ